jgi:hypothetical protein
VLTSTGARQSPPGTYSLSPALWAGNGFVLLFLQSKDQCLPMALQRLHLSAGGTTVGTPRVTVLPRQCLQKGGVRTIFR